MSPKETDAHAKAYEWIVNRVDQQQQYYNELVTSNAYIDETWLEQFRGTERHRNGWGDSAGEYFNIGRNWDQEEGEYTDDHWVNYSGAETYYSNLGLRNARNSALNEFMGGNDQTLMFFNSGSSHAQATRHNLFDAFAQISSSTYGNLYGAAFDSIGQTLLSSELSGKAVSEASLTLENQTAKTFEQQKALRKSIGQASKLFQKSKGKFRKTKKKPKARFGGFRKDTPE